MTRVDFSLQVGADVLQASAAVPSGSTTVVDLLPILQGLTSAVVGATIEAGGYNVSCKAGCGACCRQFVPISLFEADGLAGWIRTLSAEQQSVLEMRFQAALRELVSKGLLDAEKLAVFVESRSTEERQRFGLEYLQAGVPCPFLVDEACSIHPVRPLVCREYLVTSPPEFCAAPTAATVQMAPIPVVLSDVLVGLAKPFHAEGKGWIPLAFLGAWMRSGLSVASAIEMPGPELLKLVLLQLETEPAS